MSRSYQWHHSIAAAPIAPTNPILLIILRRLMIGLLTLLIITVITFAAIELLPGDIATEVLGQSATPETLAAFREQMNLNDPAIIRYWKWLSGAATGDCPAPYVWATF